MLEIRIVGRIPLLIIDPVQYPHQRLGPLPQRAIEAAAKRRRGDLASISGADGGDDVRVGDAGFEAVQVSIELNAVGVEIIGRKIGETVDSPGKTALIR